MARLARRPPSMTRVMIGVVVALICLVIFGIEYFIGWPDWMSVETRTGRLRR
jgi:hypothetical protein